MTMFFTDPRLLIALLLALFAASPARYAPSSSPAYAPPITNAVAACAATEATVYTKQGATTRALCISVFGSAQMLTLYVREQAGISYQLKGTPQQLATWLELIYDRTTWSIDYAWSGVSWFHQSLGGVLGYPTQDCGRNWYFTLKLKDQDICLGAISEQAAKALADKIRDEEMGGPLKPGEIWMESPLDRALQYMSKLWGFP